MKTVGWLYLFMFLAYFDLHAQYPVLSPFALELGATPTFIGWIMGAYALTHLPGNMLAGHGIDRYGSRFFIAFSLLAAGVLLILQSQASSPEQLFWIRSASGFCLAFLSPACLAVLAKLSSDRFVQGKLMAGNGLVHTLASVVSPAAGAALAAQLGYSDTFIVLGWVLCATALFSLLFIKEPPSPANTPFPSQFRRKTGPYESIRDQGVPLLFYATPLALSCSQGILFFEIPLLETSRQSIFTSGLLFSVISVGALCSLSMLFLNRISPLLRTVAGSVFLAFIFFGMAVNAPLPMFFSLFLIGITKGIVFPAVATLLANISSVQRYGRTYSVLSIAYSLGAFLGPIIAGQFRDAISPFFLAFLGLMIALCLLPLKPLTPKAKPHYQSPL